MTPKVYFRDAIEEDISFIFNSWLKSYRNARAVSGIASSIYFSEHHKVLERIMKSCKVTIASNPADKSQIYGYIVFEEISGITVIHYSYVKHTFRKMGIAKTLLGTVKKDLSTGSMYSHSTLSGDRIAPKYNMVYSPYLALTPDYRCNYEEVNNEEEEVQD